MGALFALQWDVAWEDGEANRACVRELLSAVAVPAGSLIVLPEMFAVGFSMNVEAVAEPPEAPNERFLAELARETRSHVLGGVVHHGDDGRGLNQAVAFDPDGGEVARYTKLFPFTYAGESDHYQPGRSVTAFEWQGLTVAPFICFDLRFPEVFRLAAWRGADVLAVLANFPASRSKHWAALTQARAIENQAYVVAVNRTGHDPNVSYPGLSRVVDPWGEVTAEADDAETVLVEHLDRDHLESCRQRFNVLGDMRAEWMPET